MMAADVDGLEPVPPMLATAGPVPVGTQWRYEFKWDGVRAVVLVAGNRVAAWSRNNLDITAGYPELTDLPSQLHGRRVVLDGELVALDDAGRPSFALLQDRMHVRGPAPTLLARVPVRYYAFDVLHLDDASTLALPYEQRRELLDSLGLPDLTDLPTPPSRTNQAAQTDGTGPADAGAQVPGRAAHSTRGIVGYAPRSFTDGPGTVAAARAFALEGVVAKRAGSVYRPAERSRDWVKHAFVHTIEVVIIGHRPGRGRRAGTIGSLLVAIPAADGTLHFAGGIGTGFRDADLHDLQQTLAPLQRRTPAVTGVPREQSRDATWTEPVLVGEAVYRNRTPDGLLRHAAWRGLRPDKTPPPVTAGAPATGNTSAPDAPAPAQVGSMQTSDGAWRIEIWRHGPTEWCRIVHGDAVIDGVDIITAHETLTAAGIDLAELTESAA